MLLLLLLLLRLRCPGFIANIGLVLAGAWIKTVNKFVSREWRA